jgi:hypothetical protein
VIVGGDSGWFLGYAGGYGTVDINDYYVCGGGTLYSAPATITQLSGYHAHRAGTGFSAWWKDCTLKNALFTNCTVYDCGSGGGNLTLIDPIQTPTTVLIEVDGRGIHIVFTCNVNVCDKNGVAISGAVVDCVDQYNTASWAAGTVTTDASGNIAEQQITYKRWYNIAKTLTTYSPHKFTISKAGYQTLVLDNITVSAPIKWHLEMQRYRLPMGRGRRELRATTV